MIFTKYFFRFIHGDCVDGDHGCVQIFLVNERKDSSSNLNIPCVPLAETQWVEVLVGHLKKLFAKEGNEDIQTKISSNTRNIAILVFLDQLNTSRSEPKENRATITGRTHGHWVVGMHSNKVVCNQKKTEAESQVKSQMKSYVLKSSELQTLSFC